MRTTTVVGLAAVLALGAGCAAAPQKKANVRVVNQAEPGSRKAFKDKTFICDVSLKHGSMMRAAICQDEREKELEREAARDQLNQMMQAPAQKP